MSKTKAELEQDFESLSNKKDELSNENDNLKSELEKLRKQLAKQAKPEQKKLNPNRSGRKFRLKRIDIRERNNVSVYGKRMKIGNHTFFQKNKTWEQQNISPKNENIISVSAKIAKRLEKDPAFEEVS